MVKQAGPSWVQVRKTQQDMAWYLASTKTRQELNELARLAQTPNAKMVMRYALKWYKEIQRDKKEEAERE